MEENSLNYNVGEAEVGLRADKFLGQVCSEFSRSRLQKMISDEDVFLNGDVLTAGSYRVVLGDVLSVRVSDPEPSEPVAEDIPLDVVYEDDDVIVINKPAGLVVHPGAGNWSGTLVNALLYHCGRSLSGIGGVIRPGIVHRLDKDTSGLMVVAKNDHAHHFLSEQFADRTLSRVYHALVFGVPVPLKGSVDRSIGRHRHNRLKMSVMSNSPKEARTNYHVLESFGEAFSLVECKLDTGRTHQIRVHMEALGHPVIGDPLYFVQPTALKSKMHNNSYSSDIIDLIFSLDRQMLHAKALRFVHPITQKEMSFEVNVPDDFSNVLKNIKK